MSNVKNVEALARLVGFCTGYGGRYNPGQQNLQVTEMSVLLANARNVMDEVIAARTANIHAVNNRQMGFKDMHTLATQVISALKACGANRLTIEDAMAQMRKLSGKRTVDRLPVPSENAMQPEVKTRKARGLDYGSVVEHFANLVKIVSTEVRYTPNEPELSVTGLESTLQTLRNLNQAVVQTRVELSKARIKRNTLFYGNENSLVDTAQAARNYVKAVFGLASEQFEEVVRIRFTKPDL
jgi:hypothetical protein